MANILQVTTNPPKIFIEAIIIAMKPSHFEIFDISLLADPRAINAPTIIIPEIALVTDIRGVCKAEVTDQTTK